MPKFCQVRQNPPRAAKSRGMDHCTCCANSTLGPKLTRVPKNGRKSSKKTLNLGGGGSRGGSTNPKENQITSQHPSQGSACEPNGQGPQRCNTHHPCGCTAKVVESGGDSYQNWKEIRGLDPKLSDSLENIKTEGVEEDWWEVLFEGIGVLPDIQSPLTSEHNHALEDL